MLYACENCATVKDFPASWVGADVVAGHCTACGKPYQFRLVQVGRIKPLPPEADG